MATRYEFQTLAARVKTVWGGSSKDWDRANNAYMHHSDRIGRIPIASLVAAVDSFVDEGVKWAPRIPQVLARATAGTEQPGRPDPATCLHPPPWSLYADGTRACRLCLTELGVVVDSVPETAPGGDITGSEVKDRKELI